MWDNGQKGEKGRGGKRQEALCLQNCKTENNDDDNNNDNIATFTISRNEGTSKW